MKKKLSDKKNKFKSGYLFSLLSATAILITAFVLSIVSSNGTSKLMGNSASNELCDTKNGWSLYEESGKSYCRKEKIDGYYCDDGYKLSGTGENTRCIKSTTTYKCRSGYQEFKKNSKLYCRRANGYNYSCPKGDQTVGSGKNTRCFSQFTDYECPKGTDKVGGGAQTGYCVEKYYDWQCPKNWDKSGYGPHTFCTITAEKQVCPSGYEKAGGGSQTAWCQKVSSITYSCPSGYEKVGSGANTKCVLYSYSYSCSKYGKDWSKIGDGPNSYCLYLKKYSPYCAKKGYTLKGDRCYKGNSSYKADKKYEQKSIVTIKNEIKILKATKKTNYTRASIKIEKVMVDKKKATQVTKYKYHSIIPVLKTIEDDYIKTPKYIEASPTPVTKTEDGDVHKNVSYELIEIPKSKIDNSTKIIDNIVNEAKKQVGNSNDKYTDWAGADWCAIFISWLFNKYNGIDKYIKQSTFADNLVRDSVNAKLGTWFEDECTDPNTKPQRGDLIVFDPSINGAYVPFPERLSYPGIEEFNDKDKYLSSHIGIVYNVDNNYVYTVEGNTGSNDPDASKVNYRKYNRKQCGKIVYNASERGINGYYRPNYYK